MSVDLQGLLGKYITTAVADQLGKQVGLSAQSSESALGGLLPVLLGALQKNTATTDGAAALNRAIDKRHSGDVFDDISGLAADPEQRKASGILQHLLGGKREAVATAVAQQTGIKAGQASSLLAMAAPLVLGALGKAKQQGGLDAGGLASLLQGGSGNSATTSLLTSFLDKDGDGKVVDDLLAMGMKTFFKA